jgi:hypothetical protein
MFRSDVRRLAGLLLPGLLGLGLLGGCGYRWTYDAAMEGIAPADAASREELRVDRWDPPDSLAFAVMGPPRVEAVILDAYYYYLIHPEGEDEFRARELRRQEREALREAEERESLAAAYDSLSLAAARDTLLGGERTAGDPAPEIKPLPPVQVDLTQREEENLLRRMRLDLQITESILNILLTEDPPERKLLKIHSVQSLTRQAEAALDRSDLRGAANLALKARSLAEDLFEGRP